MLKFLGKIGLAVSVLATIESSAFADGIDLRNPANLTVVSDVSAYNPMSYGALCNSNGTTGTDDSAAINAMFTAIRAANKPFKVVAPAGKTCFIASTINATGLNNFGVNLGLGSRVELRLDCATNGTPCVDALSSRWINWEYLYIHGESTNKPSYGIQIGRIGVPSADLHYFNRPIIQGFFTVAAFYNLASETVTVIDPFFSNDTATGTTYSIVQDGYNHFNITSAFVTETITPDTQQSFNENTFIGGWFSTSSTSGTPFWIGAATRHRFIGGYGATSGVNGALIYTRAAGSVSQLLMDVHFETTSLTDIFLISGSNSAPSLPSFTYTDHSPQASNSIFKLDTGVTSATLPNAVINIPSLQAGSGVKLFDAPSAWTVSGSIALEAAANWSASPGNFSGILCLATVCSNYKNKGSSLTNTASGYSSMNATVSGQSDTGYGFEALKALTSGSFNTATGSGALANLTTSSASSAFGFGAAANFTGAGIDVFGVNAGGFISTGARNSAFGNSALFGITGNRLTGSDNTAIGNGALLATQGAAASNTAVGSLAGAGNTTGVSNVYLGSNAGFATTTACCDVAIGSESLKANITGQFNVAAGVSSLLSSTSNGNAAVGFSSGAFVSSGGSETAIGNTAMQGITGTRITGSGNTAVGAASLLILQGAATKDTAFGSSAGASVTTGARNLSLGPDVDSVTLTTGSDNVHIGTTSAIDGASSSESNTIKIGAGSTCIICTTGAGTPSTSVTNFPGTLQAGGVAVAPNLSGTTGSIGGGALLAGACTSGTVSVTNSTTAMAVAATPATYPGDGAYWMGYVSTNGTVTVKVCAAVALTPTASAYNVRVLQ